MTKIKETTILYWQCGFIDITKNIIQHRLKELNSHYFELSRNIFHGKNQGFDYRSLLDVTYYNYRIWKQNGNDIRIERNC